MKYAEFLFIATLIIIGCDTREARDKIEFVRQYYNKEVLLPTNPIFFYAPSYDSSFTSSFSTIIVYTDGECSKCIGELKEWQDFICPNTKRFPKTRFLFISYAHDYLTFESHLQNMGIHFPQNYDSSMLYVNQNNLHNPLLYSMLINCDNRIVLIGNPVNNHKLALLSFREIDY